MTSPCNVTTHTYIQEDDFPRSTLSPEAENYDKQETD